MSLDKFTERRTLFWGDTLVEVQEEVKNLKFDKEERAYFRNLIAKGEEYQEQLNEDWLDKGFMSYKQYMTQILRYISLQDMIINDIRGFIKNSKEYNKKSSSKSKSKLLDI